MGILYEGVFKSSKDVGSTAVDHKNMFVADLNQGKRKKRTWREFIRKYFVEGHLTNDEEELDVLEKTSNWSEFFDRNRKLFAMLIPFSIVQFFWLQTAFRHDFFSLYPKHWVIPVTTMFGSTIGGMTSEGSGAVFFPVMTILLGIDATTSRDYSVMCQSFGMGCSFFSIWYMGVQIEVRTLLFVTVGSIPGMIVGFEWIDPLFDLSIKKMFFVSVWGSFAIALYLLNVEKKRRTYPIIPEFCAWKAVLLMVNGFVGGIFTALAGSGVDVCSFSLITLLFRVSEKTATPTSVAIMGLNTVFAFYWRAVQMGTISQTAWEYLAVCIPACTVAAPLGSVLGSYLHRQVLAWLLYTLEFTALVGFLVSGPPIHLLLVGATIIVCGFLFFNTLSVLGKRLMVRVERRKTERLQRVRETAWAEKEVLIDNGPNDTDSV